MRTAEASTSEKDGLEVELLYRHRFPPCDRARRNAVWKVLCRQWFSRYVPAKARVLEVAGGYCEFINNIEAAERVTIDLNPETSGSALPGVVVHQIAAERLAEVLPHSYFDVVFMSNFLEHCKSREAILEVLQGTRLVLKPKGRLLVLGPNFRYCYRHYFDYFDHRLPLTEKAVVEALQLVGLEIELIKPRTLPFTFRSSLPQWPWLVSLYLRFPFLWPLFGAQFFIVARRPS
jgi:SAM-dependent methyltransferase